MDEKILRTIGMKKIKIKAKKSGFEITYLSNKKITYNSV